MAGLEVCDRLCLTQAMEPKLLRQYDDLEFAVLMPWIDGETWFDIVYAKQPIDSTTSMQLAKNTAGVLAGLEAQDVAHCDIAGANVIVNAGTDAVGLIDVEDMYGTGLHLTEAFPAGTAGYQHLSLNQAQHGQWCAEGDRFSGAILLAEILTWHHPEIRTLSDSEYYFSPQELQNPSSLKYHLMHEALSDIDPELSDLFLSAWTSADLSACPPLTAWARGLQVDALPPRASGAKIAPTSKGHMFRSHVQLVPPVIEPLAPVSAGQSYEIRWSVVDGASRYELQEAKSSILAQAEIFEPIYKNQHTSFECSHSNPGDKFYRVRALNDHAEGSPWSEVGSIEIQKSARQAEKGTHVPTAPSQPTHTATPGNSAGGEFTLKIPGFTIATLQNTCVQRNEPYVISWSPVPNADRYEIFQAINDVEIPEEHKFKKMIETNHNAHRLVHTSPGRRFFKVRARNFQGQHSPWGEVLCIDVVDQKHPQDHNAAQVGTLVNIEWLPKEFSWHRDSIKNVIVGNLVWQSAPSIHRYRLEWNKARKNYKVSHERFFNTNEATCEFNPGEHLLRVCALDSNGKSISQWSHMLRVEVYYDNSSLRFKHSFIT